MSNESHPKSNDYQNNYVKSTLNAAMMDTTDPPGSGDREEREVRKLTLETLLREGVLESGDGVLSMEYMVSYEYIFNDIFVNGHLHSQ